MPESRSAMPTPLPLMPARLGSARRSVRWTAWKEPSKTLGTVRSSRSSNRGLTRRRFGARVIAAALVRSGSQRSLYEPFRSVGGGVERDDRPHCLAPLGEAALPFCGRPPRLEAAGVLQQAAEAVRVRPDAGAQAGEERGAQRGRFGLR